MALLAAIARRAPRRLSGWIRGWLPAGTLCQLLEIEALTEVKDGRYDVAERILLRLVDTAERVRGKREAAAGRARFRLAGFYFLLKEHESAELHARQALTLLQTPLNPEAYLIPDAFELLAEAQFERGAIGAAEKTIARALHVMDQRLHDKPGELAHLQWIFSRLLFRQSRYESAVPVYQAALRGYLSIEGPESVSVSQLVLELGNAQRKSGNCLAAIETLERALHTQETLTGPASLAVTPYLSLLGTVYADCGQRARAVDCYQRTLEVYERTMPTGHPKIGHVLFHLADSLSGLRRYHEAERMARQAVNILKSAEDAGLSEATQVLASIKADRGQDEEADRLFSTALLMLERRVGENHIDVAESLDRHAAVVWKLGRYEEAEEMMTRASGIRKVLTV